MNLIAQAVAPLKAAAVEAATNYAKDLIARIHKDLETHGWNADKAAPRGNSFKDGRNEYIRKNAKSCLYDRVTCYVRPDNYIPHPPNIRAPSATAEAKFIREAAEDAAATYEGYVAKLTQKIGGVTTAELDGSYVWSLSYLFVTKVDGSQEKWKTQQIINQSKLGKVYNQWPTRKVK